MTFTADRGDRQHSRNTFVGTPYWIAREVLQLGRADIWSFGILAPELAHGHALLLKYHQIKSGNEGWNKSKSAWHADGTLHDICNNKVHSPY
ncbi:protein kinase superfamily protein [Tanacetum coccineum]